MKKLFLILLLVTVAWGDTLRVGGLNRSYLLFTPEGGSGKMPLVVVLHDRDSSPVHMARMTQMHELGSREKFMVVYPEAVGKLWIDGRQQYDRETRMNLQDDVDFLGTLVSTLLKSKPVDPARVFILGYGNGGRMALRMALERPDLFAAVGAVGASLPELVDRPLGRPVSLILLNGTVDPMVPETGGPVQAGVELGRVLSAAATAARFVTADGCSGPVQETLVPGVTAEHWQNGRGGTEVVNAHIQDWTHDWPTKFDVGAVLWDFLKRQHR